MAVRPEVPDGAAEGTLTVWRPVQPPYGPPEQFDAGRRAAGAALFAAGAAERKRFVPREPDGRPGFPPGFPGSIAHTDRLAIALVVPGASSVGVDIESAVITARMARFVLRGLESQTLLPPVGDYTMRELFAAKEAAFKALYASGALEEFPFWWIELAEADGVLIASYRGSQVPVWIRSEPDLSLAVAIRR
ncbi:4'-phosphopantetheinyl transferase superfamily protein [Nonomuraea soli]|uniref:4'-phosphopantetheinyl transferase EntD n=1 Tax=Nonomuraea soli TaxID=1032476 RepID=A0A7W0CGU0_9ACTN|nr:4'-phosphopantetheinyl transferase superfamily protein [Nonomuraea soli]MBA2890836.1 4'-phosphopantetheinyl transferase EntD [Nonomuraea soli]